jgi:hypothetical protein
MNTQIAAIQPAKTPQTVQPHEVMMNDEALDRLWRVAQIMADSKVTIPKELQGKVGDCFAVVMQAAQWGMNPFSVAQKTHFVNGAIGYEAQLVNAVITTRAPVTGRLNFEWYGDWSKVNGKEDKSFERGVIVSATIKGEDEPRVLNLSMGQVGSVRNSPNWAADPRQQIAYLATKRWARLYCPDVILGVYTPDDFEDQPEKDITPAAEPAKPHSGSSALKNRLKDRQAATVVEATAVESPAKPKFDHEGCKAALEAVTNMEDFKLIVSSIPQDLDEPERTILRKAATEAKARLKAEAAKQEAQQAESPADALIRRMASADRDTLDQLAVEIDMFDAEDQDRLNAAYSDRLNHLINQ